MRLEEYARYDGLGLAQLITDKQVTTNELIQTALTGIEKLNPAINAVVQVLDQDLISSYQKSSTTPFKGIPFLMKEYPVHAKDIKIQLGSRLAKKGIAPETDSSLMTRFIKAGLVPIGTTTTPELAVDGSTESLLYGPTHNPWKPKKTTGGSSGGAAAAIASGMVPLAHANDSGGSIRLPASYCNLVGLKPTRGRVPSGPFSGDPLFGLATEFALTKSVRDTAALLDAVSGPDVGSYGWADPPKKPFLESISEPSKPLKIAIMTTPSNGAQVDPEIDRVLKETAKLCEELGHGVDEDFPEVDEEIHFKMKLHYWTATMFKEINEVAKQLNEIPSEKNLEPIVHSAYKYGKHVTTSDLLDAIDIQNNISRNVGQFFTKYDILISPTNALLPSDLGILNTNKPYSDVTAWFKHSNKVTAFQGLYNTTGQPALSLPLGWSEDGHPIGIQLVSRFADETTLLNLAHKLEDIVNWKDKKPIQHVSIN